MYENSPIVFNNTNANFLGRKFRTGKYVLFFVDKWG